jgi:tetratricopeptide (TPR) repeat protein
MSRASRWMSMAYADLTATARNGDAPTELEGRIWVERAFLRHNAGRVREAEELCNRAIECAQRTGADDVLGRALHLLDLVELAAGRPGDEGRVEQARDLFERAGDLPRQAGAWNHLGMRAYFRGDWDDALDRYRHAQAIHERSGDDWSAAICSANAAEILLDQGRVAEAEPSIVAALQVWRASAAPSYVGFGAVLLGRLYTRTGRPGPGMALLGEAVAAYSSIGERFEVIDAELRIAEALLLRGQATAAMQRLADTEASLLGALRAAGVLAGEASRASELPPSVPPATTLWRLRGCALAQLGDRRTAASLLERSALAARDRGARHDLTLALAAQVWLLGEAAGPAVAEVDALRRSLGITWLPDLPRTAAATVDVPEPATVVPAQRQATETTV